MRFVLVSDHGGCLAGAHRGRLKRAGRGHNAGGLLASRDTSKAVRRCVLFGFRVRSCHVRSESVLLLPSPLTLEVNCRQDLQFVHVPRPVSSLLSLVRKPGSARDIRSVYSSDQGTTHQPDSLTRGSTASSTVLLLQESTFVPVFGASGCLS